MLIVGNNKQCNLTSPCCSNCSRRGELCSFQLSSCSSLTEKTRDQDKIEEELGFNGYLSSSVAPTVRKWQPSMFSGQSRLESELICHFTTLCAPSLALTSNARFLWECEVPLTRSENPFLNQAVLALSALHLCHLKPSHSLKYANAARKRFAGAINQFQDHVNQITSGNCVALFGFSVIIAMFQLKLSADAAAKETIQDDQQVAGFDAITALRATWKLTPSLGPWLLQTRLRTLLARGRDFDEQGYLDANQELVFSRLEMLNLNNIQVEGSQVDCSQALDALRYWYTFMGRRLTIWLHVVWWPAAITDDFLRLLKSKDRMALAIYCFWVLGMTRVSQKWFMDGWASAIFRSVLCSLDPEWRRLVEWALKPILETSPQTDLSL